MKASVKTLLLLPICRRPQFFQSLRLNREQIDAKNHTQPNVSKDVRLLISDHDRAPVGSLLCRCRRARAPVVLVRSPPSPLTLLNVFGYQTSDSSLFRNQYSRLALTYSNVSNLNVLICWRTSAANFVAANLENMNCRSSDDKKRFEMDRILVLGQLCDLWRLPVAAIPLQLVVMLSR